MEGDRAGQIGQECSFAQGPEERREDRISRVIKPDDSSIKEVKKFMRRKPKSCSTL